MKKRTVFLYHPVLEKVSDDINFGSMLENLRLIGRGVFVIGDDNSTERHVVRIGGDGNKYLISIQKLKTEDLPKVANSNDGSNETDLTIPDGTALSFKNVFAYDREKGVMAAAKLGSCPQIKVFRDCIQKIARENISGCENVIVVTSMIFERGLTERLMRIESITMAEFRSDDFYGEEISGTRLEHYKEYLSGHGYTKTTKLKGLEGRFLRRTLAPIIEDIIANHGMLPEHINIRMKADGEDIDFGKYYKKYIVEVSDNETNRKYLNYDDLEDKLTNIIEEYHISYEE